VIGAIDLAAAYGLKVIAKNPFPSFHLILPTKVAAHE
jgi:hypothetical protein